MLAASAAPRTSMVTRVGVPGQVEGRLPGGVAAADHVHVLAAQRRRLGDRRPVEDAAPDEALEARDPEPPVAAPVATTTARAATAAAVGQRDHAVGAVRARGRWPAREDEPGAEQPGLLVRRAGQLGAADAAREARGSCGSASWCRPGRRSPPARAPACAGPRRRRRPPPPARPARRRRSPRRRCRPPVVGTPSAAAISALDGSDRTVPSYVTTTGSAASGTSGRAASGPAARGRAGSPARGRRTGRCCG